MASSLFGGPLGRLAKYSVAAGAAGWMLQSSLYNVEPGHRALIYDHVRGILDKVQPEGTHFRIPYLQYPIVIDVRTRPRILNTITGTKDLQQVSLSLRILSRPVEEQLKQVYRTLGQDYDERILPSVGNEVLKAVVAQYNADQLLTLRDKVSSEIRHSLTKRAAEFNITLDDVAITHLTFSKDFAAAIEHKEVAFQQAETAKFLVQKAEQEKRAAIIQAEGDAEAAKMFSEAINKHGSGFLDLRRIETAQTLADTLSKSRNVTYLPNRGNLLMNLPSAFPVPPNQTQQQ